MIEIEGEGRTIGEIMAGKHTGPSIATATPIVLGRGTAYMQTSAATLDLDAAVQNIERGVPLPPSKIPQKGSKWLPLLKSMVAGDSVFFAGAKIEQMGYARTVAKKHDFTISIRAVTGGVRLWLIDPTDDGLGG